MIEKKIRGQMSEAVSTAIILTLSGGLQDAYTYYFRGRVFANAQTGNIIILGHNLIEGHWHTAFFYLLPVIAFGTGIYVSEVIRGIFKEHKLLHWRQIVILIEIFLLFLVGFLPQSCNLIANVTVSFVCAMQVEAFRKVRGSAFASTMCIGNLRSATEMLYHYHQTKDGEILKKCLRYYGVIICFGIGAATGSFLTPLFAEKTIWFSCGLLIVAFCIMFIHEDIGMVHNQKRM